ncbi:hypothetical protein DITRI_Ditri06bG0038000 [Diplodiscus trichospermus]
MLGEFITRVLVLILGFAYPAFECFKTVEKNKVEIEELRFWCQYWIVVAFLTVFERIGDILISWLPMYDELKLALLIYLWYPKTKGTAHIYETLLRPYMTRHETEFERKMQEFRVRAWDFALYYWQNCTELGQTKTLEMIQYLFGQPSRLKHGNLKSELQTPGILPVPPNGFRKNYDYSDDSSILESPRNSKPQQPRSWFRRSKHT